ncbi:MAG TPA: hypothetical protein VG961_02185, partial [Ignavibacteria bacterium]|nr:hypothetical protein [Ignavibacteria bacterium]
MTNKNTSHLRAALIFAVLFIFQFTYSQKIPQDKIDELSAKIDSICLPLKSAGIKVSCKVVHADFNKVL